ncbi:hypothetical protein, partial [Hymenobacter saemangeumensis]|uniref:hypothetical protein n=1 Tax=Hymenobacter saemangeumensis TaxID=1084522 RepID=UPI0031E76AFA
MTYSLRLFSFLLLVLSLGLARPAQASHAQGGDLTYAPLGNNLYRVTCRFYRDCSGIAAPTSINLTMRNGACNTQGSQVTLARQGNPIYGSQYCATISGVCTMNGPDNYEANTYVGDVTLPPGLWTLSAEETARPTLANLNNGQSGTLRLEATLDNRSGLQNTSPVFSTIPAFFVPVGQNSIVSHNAFDADGDSLVYSLERPLNACGIFETYSAYPVACSSTVLSSVPPCVLSCQSPATYSATLPIAVTNDTIGSCPNKTVAPNFYFDFTNGSLSLTPAIFNATAPSTQGLNKYVAVVKVSEYRRVGGALALIGSVRRELIFTVYDCGTNVNPNIAPTGTIQVGTTSRTVNLNQIIPVQSGEPLVLTLAATDANAGQNLTYSIGYNALPGVQLMQLMQLPARQARLTFTPPLSLRDGLYRVAVTVEDDACPIKGSETRTLTFRVFGSPLAGRSARPVELTAAPNPFREQVQFQLPTAGV